MIVIFSKFKDGCGKEITFNLPWKVSKVPFTERKAKMKNHRMFFKIILIIILCFALISCGCDHNYDQGVIAKEATFIEEGEIIYTCSICGDSYTESIPIREDEVIVTVTDKINLTTDYKAGRYSDRVEFKFKIENMTKIDIKGVQGTLLIKDLFDNDISSIDCDFTGKIIPAGDSISVSDLGVDINEFLDNDNKLYKEDFGDLKFEYSVSDVIFSDTTTSKNNSKEDKLLRSQKIVVVVTNKKNLSADWNAGRFSPRVEFEFEVSNTTDKNIKGVQGILTINDMFGSQITSIDCDFTGKTIPAKGYIYVSGLGVDINEFIDEDIKLYSEIYSDLIFNYDVKNVVYEDGSMEEITTD